MDLESRMREKSHCGVCGKNDCQCVVNGISINKYLTLDDALTIAREHAKGQMENVKKLIILYEKVLHGDKNSSGLFDCYDTYYVGCWDNDLAEIQKLKQLIEAQDGK